jgi:DNA-directed RNA polymerase specialized sigma24 family protein
MLRAVQEMSVTETAAALDLPEATVDSVAHPATGALLQGVRPFLPHRPETRLVRVSS